MKVSFKLEEDYKDYLIEEDFESFFCTGFEELIFKDSKYTLCMNSDFHKPFLTGLMWNLEKHIKSNEVFYLRSTGTPIIFYFKSTNSKIEIKEFDELENKVNTKVYFNKRDFLQEVVNLSQKYEREIISVQPKFIKTKEYKNFKEIQLNLRNLFNTL